MYNTIRLKHNLILFVYPTDTEKFNRILILILVLGNSKEVIKVSVLFSYAIEKALESKSHIN